MPHVDIRGTTASTRLEVVYACDVADAWRAIYSRTMDLILTYGPEVIAQSAGPAIPGTKHSL
jgi:hypothetical protein